MNNIKFIELENYLNKEMIKMVNLLFEKLKLNNIDIRKSSLELNRIDAEIYKQIYNDYTNEIIELKKNTIKKYGNIIEFEHFFNITLCNITNEIKDIY